MKLPNTGTRWVLLICTLVGTPSLGAGNGSASEPSKTPDPRPQAANVVAYPKRISFPDDLKSSEIVQDMDDNWVVRFPIATYSFYHYGGWQDFLNRYGHAGEPIDMKWKQPITPVRGGEFRAMEDGFEACQRKVLEGSRTTRDADLRELARRAYFPSLPPPPKQDKNGGKPKLVLPTP